MRLSIIIPVLDEGERIAAALDALVDLRVLGAEIVVVDGGSRDATIQRARLRADVVLQGPRPQAERMNVGAAKAAGDVLLFLRTDMQLPPLADHLILDGLARSDRAWGHFDATLEGKNLLLPVAAWLTSLESRITGIATIEHGIFAKRDAFRTSGGFPTQPLLDDVELCVRLKRISKPLCIRQRVVSPGHRWETEGILHTLMTTWRLRLAYLFGADPEALAKRQEAAAAAKAAAAKTATDKAAAAAKAPSVSKDANAAQ
jgi:rSAM/selenodomain-associated transferase 2